MPTKIQTVTLSLGGRNITVQAALAPGEKVVTAEAAQRAVLTGKTIRPIYHDDKLQVKYNRTLGLQWEGGPEVIAKTLSGPQYLWKSLNNDPESLWIVPAEPTQRGKWFDGSSKTHVEVSSMTEGHLDNALSWLALKSSELKAEKKRRANEKAKAEAEVEAQAKAKASQAKKKEKAKARYEARQVETMTGQEALEHMFTKGGKVCEKRMFERLNFSSYYFAEAGKLKYRGKVSVYEGLLADYRCFLTDNRAWVAV